MPQTTAPPDDATEPSAPPVDDGVPPRLVEVAAAAYVAVVLALTTGPQPPGRFDLVGNIVLFVPIGGLLVLRFPRLHPAAVVVLGFAASAAIEVTQLVMLRHRDPSLNDLALNTAGTALGAVAGLAALDLVAVARRRWWDGRRRGRA